MPYKLVGNTIYHMKNGKWSVKQRAKNLKNAKAAMRLLYAIEKDPNFKPK